MLFRSESDVLIKYINARFCKGLGTNIFIIGLSGTGKSSASMRIGELVIKSREEDNLKMFITDSLLKLLKAIRQSKYGDIIIIEEVSVLFPSRRAMGTDNLSIAKVFDTIRKKKLCIISNAPLWKAIDSHMKSMGHILIETLVIRKKEEVVISKFYRLQTNPASGKTYTHIMKRKGRDVPLLFTRKPSKELWDNYEKDKDAFMEKLYIKLQAEQIKKETKENKSLEIDQPKIRKLTTRELEVHQLLNIKKLKKIKIAEILGVSPPRITNIIKNIRKKTEIPKESEDLTLKTTHSTF